MPYSLVIVESPGKIKKIGEALGPAYRVVASYGHIRDLPKKDLGVAFHGDTITPRYEITDNGKKSVPTIKKLAKDATTVFLASDPDREGEAIAWHIAQVLDKGRATRVTFNEITKTAITRAIAAPRIIDMNLVNAQQARRVLDRVVGWVVSPTLSKGTGNKDARSAGRVQSVAVRLVVEREREIQKFKPTNYFVLDAQLEAIGIPPAFKARLLEWGGTPAGYRFQNKTDVETVIEICRQGTWTVFSIESKPSEKRSPAPFTTSTLQQAASAALHWPPKQTMAAAQRLYEAGHITYMRTDSTVMAAEAVQEIRAFISTHHPDCLPDKPLVHETKSESAQEAHECIRVTHVEDRGEALQGEEADLYRLIWTRTVASQMKAGLDQVTTILVGVGGVLQAGRPQGLFQARGVVRQFDGWRRLLAEAAEDRPDQEKDAGDPADGEAPLPSVKAGQGLELRALDAVSKATKPPPRYKQASLIKALEKNGVGRPSTYAAIMGTILSRGYVNELKEALHASPLGIQVVDFLVHHFEGDFIDVNFTKDMEEDLDRIAAGKLHWQPSIAQASRALVGRARAAGLSYDPLAALDPEAADSQAAPVPGQKCPKCDGGMLRREGKYGPFLGCAKYPKCKGLVNLPAEAPKGAVVGQATPAAPEKGHLCPLCKSPMAARTGKNGQFMSCSAYPKCKGTRNIDGSVGRKK